MTKYYILFTKKAVMKTTNIKNNCIAKIKTTKKIQHTKIHKSHVLCCYISI